MPSPYGPYNQICSKDKDVVGLYNRKGREYYDIRLTCYRTYSKVCSKSNCYIAYRQCKYICISVKRGVHTACGFSLTEHMTKDDTARMIVIPFTWSPTYRCKVNCLLYHTSSEQMSIYGYNTVGWSQGTRLLCHRAHDTLWCGESDFYSTYTVSHVYKYCVHYSLYSIFLNRC